MAKLEFPQVFREIRMEEYMPELGGQEGATIRVWVNVPKPVIDDLFVLVEMKEEDPQADKLLLPWLMKVWVASS